VRLELANPADVNERLRGLSLVERLAAHKRLEGLSAQVRRSGVGRRIPSLLPRWVHRWWARLLGYFWLPCPTCGRSFGGHERRAGIVDLVPHGRGLLVCRECASILKRLGEARLV
jgi:hypothetical protein